MSEQAPPILCECCGDPFVPEEPGAEWCPSCVDDVLNFSDYAGCDWEDEEPA